MRCTIDRKALTTALKTVGAANPKGAALPILAGVRIEARATGVDLLATNLDLTIGTTVDDPTDVTAGVTIAPAALLTRVVDRLKGETITLDLQTGDGLPQLVVSSGKARFELRTFLVDDWPKLPPPGPVNARFDLATVDLIQRILPMASADQNRPVITGVYFADGRVAATDSYRLGVLVDLDLDVPPALIPAATLKLALAAGEPVDVSVDERSVTFAAGPTTWTCRLIEGEYPNYWNLVRQAEARTVRVRPGALVDAIATVTAIGGKEEAGVRIEFAPGRAAVTSIVQNVGVGETEIEVDTDLDLRVGFNPRYLGDMLRAFDEDDEITLDLVDALKPVQARSGHLLGLVMPVRLS